MGRHKILINFIVMIAYLITARIGLLLALQPGFSTPFWPPSGIAVAAVLLFGCPIWPGIFIGAFLSNLLIINSLSVSLLVSCVVAISSTLQPLAIGYLLKNLTTSIPYLLNTRRNIISFLVFTLVGCTISATLSVVALSLAGIVSKGSLLTNWLTWWLGDTIGIYVFTPFLFSWFNFWSKPQELKEVGTRGFELFQLVLLTLAISYLSFSSWDALNTPIEDLLLPCMIWAAFRFPPQIATTLVVISSVIAVIGTAAGYSPFIQPGLNESLLMLQIFIGILSSTTLIMISAIQEIWHGQRVQERYSEELKNQVKKLQDREKKPTHHE